MSIGYECVHIPYINSGISIIYQSRSSYWSPHNHQRERKTIPRIYHIVGGASKSLCIVSKYFQMTEISFLVHPAMKPTGIKVIRNKHKCFQWTSKYWHPYAYPTWKGQQRILLREATTAEDRITGSSHHTDHKPFKTGAKPRISCLKVQHCAKGTYCDCLLGTCLVILRDGLARGLWREKNRNYFCKKQIAGWQGEETVAQCPGPANFCHLTSINGLTVLEKQLTHTQTHTDTNKLPQLSWLHCTLNRLPTFWSSRATSKNRGWWGCILLKALKIIHSLRFFNIS